MTKFWGNISQGGESTDLFFALFVKRIKFPLSTSATLPSKLHSLSLTSAPEVSGVFHDSPLDRRWMLVMLSLDFRTTVEDFAPSLQTLGQVKQEWNSRCSRYRSCVILSWTNCDTFYSRWLVSMPPAVCWKRSNNSLLGYNFIHRK